MNEPHINPSGDLFKMIGHLTTFVYFYSSGFNQEPELPAQYKGNFLYPLKGPELTRKITNQATKR